MHELTTQALPLARAEANRLMIDNDIDPAEANRRTTAAYQANPSAAARLIAPDLPETWADAAPPTVADLTADAAPATPPSDGPTLASYVYDLRADKGLTIAALATRLRLTAHDTERIETGRYAPGPAVCQRVADVLGGDPATMQRLSDDLAAVRGRRGRRKAQVATAAAASDRPPALHAPDPDNRAAPMAVAAADEPEPPGHGFPRLLWQGLTRRIVQTDADRCVVEGADGADAMGAQRWTHLVTISDDESEDEA